MDNTLLSNDVGLKDLGGEVTNLDRASVVVKHDILARRRDERALVDEQGRVDDARSNNVLAKDSGDVSGVGLGSDKLVDRVVGGDKERDSDHGVDSANERAILHVAQER